MASSTPKRSAWEAHPCAFASMVFIALALTRGVTAPSAHAAEPVDALHDTSVLVDAELTAGAPATVWVGVQAATDLFTSRPLEGAEVDVRLEREGRPAGVAQSAKTGPDGSALVGVVAPREAGIYTLVVATRSPLGSDRVERNVVVAAKEVLRLVSDRTSYQPGQPLRWRTTSLNRADAHPLAGEVVTVELRDPKGTLLWREEAKTDVHGMASGAIPTSEAMSFGRYALDARAGGQAAHVALDVERAERPRLLVTFEDVVVKPDGAVSGRVRARYPYGEDAHGSVQLRIFYGARRAVVDGALDARGGFSFATEVGPPNARASEVRFVATVDDGTKKPQVASHEVAVARLGHVEVALVPAHQTLAPGQATALTVISSDGLGNLVPGRVRLTARRGTLATLDAASDGALRVEARADLSGRLEVESRFVASAGTEISATASRGPSTLPTTIDARDALVAPGSKIVASGRWDKKLQSPVVVTLMRDDTPLVATVARVEDGALTAELVAPPGVFGLCTLRAAELRWDGWGELSVREATTLVYLAPATLAVELASETRHAPGADARVAVRVRDATGRPVEGVGLAASVVDERALALSKEPLDLVNVLAALDSVRATLIDRRSGEEAGVVFARLLTSAAPSARIAATALLETLRPDHQAPPTPVNDAGPRLAAERRRESKVVDSAQLALDAALEPAFVRAADGAWQVRAELHALLAEVKWPESERLTPWSKPITWAYFEQLRPDARTALGSALAQKRLAALAQALVKAQAKKALVADPAAARAALVANGKVAAHLFTDPWGQPIAVTVERRPDEGRNGRPVRCVVLRSLGPDGVAHSADDVEHVDVFGDHRPQIDWAYGLGYSGDGTGGGGDGIGRIQGLGTVTRDDMVQVRRRFDETVLWMTGLATDARGERFVDVPLADSITGWKMKVEAVSPDGAVGVAEKHLETFLPLHLDAEQPTSLVVGDRFHMPIVVANHSGRSRVLGIVGAASGGLTLETPSARVTLEDGARTAIEVPLVATSAGVGRYKLTLVSFDDAGEGVAVDALERELPVEPLGALVRSTTPARVEGGAARFEVDVQQDAAPGSAKARLQVYRGVADLSLDGLDGMLKEPHGCFEQTSSTTHPNLLVLDLLKDKPGFEGARDKARTYVAKGYQRLVGYEVEGGGFSLFGRAPASVKLTAYGLVEFVDMARVFPVDPALIARTKAWLLAQQRGDGSFASSEAAAPDERRALTAFVAWALAESGEEGAPLDKALAFLGRQRSDAASAYELALWAAAEARARKTPVAGPRLRTFASAVDGKLAYGVAPEGETLMYARGLGATVQTTALAATALARIGASGDAGRAMEWLWAARGAIGGGAGGGGAGGWGSTHGTMLALRAASVVFDPHTAKALPASLAVTIDGRAAGTIDLTVTRGVPGVDLALAPGAHEIALSAPNGDGLRADLALSWRTAAAPSAEDRGLVVTLSGDETTRVGETLKQTIALIHPDANGAPVSMPTLVIPVPPGFRADPGTLGALRSVAGVAAVDDVGAEVHVYLTTIAPGATLTFELGLEAVVPCVVTQRPVSVYAYYDPTTRGATSARRLSAGARR